MRCHPIIQRLWRCCRFARLSWTSRRSPPRPAAAARCASARQSQSAVPTAARHRSQRRHCICAACCGVRRLKTRPAACASRSHPAAIRSALSLVPGALQQQQSLAASPAVAALERAASSLADNLQTCLARYACSPARFPVQDTFSDPRGWGLSKVCSSACIPSVAQCTAGCALQGLECRVYSAAMVSTGLDGMRHSAIVLS